MDDGSITKADVHFRRAVHAGKRGIERLEAVFAHLLRSRLHLRFVELYDVGAGGKQILDLGIHCPRIVCEGKLRLCPQRPQNRPL